MTGNSSGLDRREFLGVLSAGVVGAGLAEEVGAAEPATRVAATTRNSRGLLDSPPVLQNPSSNGVTVVWAVSAPATGWVEYGATPELGQRAETAAYGLRPFD